MASGTGCSHHPLGTMPLAAQPWMFWYRTSMHVVSSASRAESLLTVTVGPGSGTFIVTVRTLTPSGRRSLRDHLGGDHGRLAVGLCSGGGTAGSQAAEQGQGADSGANRLNAHVDPSDPAGPLGPGSYPVIEGQRAYHRAISDCTCSLCSTFIICEAANGSQQKVLSGDGKLPLKSLGMG